MANSNNPPPAFELDELMQRADDFAKREPTKAVISAFGVGFLINLLPLGAIASALVGIASSLVRPTLLLLGVVKAFEYCHCGETREVEDAAQAEQGQS